MRGLGGGRRNLYSKHKFTFTSSTHGTQAARDPIRETKSDALELSTPCRNAGWCLGCLLPGRQSVFYF